MKFTIPDGEPKWTIPVDRPPTYKLHVYCCRCNASYTTTSSGDVLADAICPNGCDLKPYLMGLFGRGAD